jgi:hypothetical protein
VHAPLTQADAAQGTAAPYSPLELHVCTPLLEHWVAPGAHTPVQVPPTQAWFEQAAPFCQDPLPSQVCTT